MTMPMSSTAGMKMRCAEVMLEKFIDAELQRRGE
jgi:hypothetical protein